ncbi:class I SAM-dependent methyltransferase [Ramlibacter sp.]|uniref:class I SAM-dependent methyltransferase n=1 Tax=Ramlibacter sp. TaxID=1917967 RepID=UPI002D5A8F4C|nr:class I SAM-dependent methyltransferase [Ramlibacter sp.]HYD76448.1 class I SAM-dependent methyltransferase [Ramlibacter sp.]
MSADPFAQLKAAQREGWSLFAPLETHTTVPAAELVRHARIREGQAVLDLACGTGVVALTAARLGARVSALDLSPALLEHARRHAELADVKIDFREGDVEALPYENASFEVVLSQFGHMFAPRPDVAVGEMLRVLKPGGTIAFSTWPPEHFVGQMFALVARYVPPPEGAAPPPQWGEPGVIRQRLGDAVRDLSFRRGVMVFPTLSPQHYRKQIEETLGPVAKLVAGLKDDAARLAAFRSDLDAFIAQYLEGNVVRQDFLMTRAEKR